MYEIDTRNDFLVGVTGDELVALRPIPQRLSKPEALRLAAYLALLADDEGTQFHKVLMAIRNT